ncbi:MAG: hypothetical protein ABI432_05400 [Flavobacteriales bacterium]
MKRRLLLLIVLLALGGLAWWLSQHNGPSTLDRPLTDFAVQDTSKVDRIFIAEKNGKTVDLRRTPKGWMVNDLYLAKAHEIGVLLKTFLRIEVRSPVPKSAEPMTLRVMAAGAKKVEIYEGGDKPSKIWLVGHATKDHFGTYMVLEKPDEGRSSAPFVMSIGGFTGVLNTRFHATIDDWRDPMVFQFKDLYDLASVEVTLPGRMDASYKIENGERGIVRLLSPQGQPLPMDTILVKGALLPYQIMNFEYIDRSLKPASRDSLITAQPAQIVKVTARDGTSRTARFWYMPYAGEEPAFGEPKPLHDPVRMHALVQDTLLVVVQRQIFDPILQPATSFRP